MTAMEQASDSIVITDIDGGIVYVNKTFEASTGYSREECVSKQIDFLRSGVHDRQFYDEMWETLLANRVWEGEK